MTGSRFRLISLVALGVLLAVWAAYGPYVLSDTVHWAVTPARETVSLIAGLLWVTVLGIAYGRDAAGRMWKLILASLVASTTWVLGYLPGDWPWTIAQLLAPLQDVIFIHIVLAFPGGRLPHRFDRRVMQVLYLTLIGGTISYLFWEPPFLSSPDCVAPGACPHNALLLWPSEQIATAFRMFELLVPVFGVLVLLELRRHWREAGPAKRRTLAPVMVGVPVSLAILVPWYVAQAIDRDEVRQFLLHPVFLLPSMIIPAGFLLGLLRTRLARGSLADLAVELGRGIPVGGLRLVLARTLRDPSLLLAFPAPDGDGWVDPDGDLVPVSSVDDPSRATTRLEGDGGEVLAVIVHDPQIDVEDPGLVAAVGAIARLALENERLAAQVRAQLAEVRASRLRIVEAGDAERRRVERDLHDGAQQRLVALAMRLQLERERGGDSRALIDDASAELEAAIAEVRDLARGLHPAILSEAGLAAAIDSLAERAPMPVRVEAPEQRFPRGVEATAYYVTAEGLTNVARHAGATEARVRVTVDGDHLTIDIADDGVGGADLDRGSGLRGLVDRVAAAGGSLSVTSPAGAGTLLHAELPLA